MKYRALIIFLTLFTLLFSFRFGPSLVKSFSNSEIRKTSLKVEKLTSLVNKWRVESGFQRYERSEGLCKIAEDRTKDGTDYHKGLYEKYSHYPSVIQENSTGGLDEQIALDAWLTSPPHRATLEKPYKYSCVATDGYFAVQIFSSCENGCP